MPVKTRKPFWFSWTVFSSTVLTHKLFNQERVTADKISEEERVCKPDHRLLLGGGGVGFVFSLRFGSIVAAKFNCCQRRVFFFFLTKQLVVCLLANLYDQWWATIKFSVNLVLNIQQTLPPPNNPASRFLCRASSCWLLKVLTLQPLRCLF